MTRPWTAFPLLLALLPADESRASSVSCDAGPGGLSSLLVEGDGARLQVRQTDAGYVIDIDDAGDGLVAGSLRCPPARAVQVVPGNVMGTSTSRVVVTLGDRAPRVVQAEDRVRLLWLPAGAAAAAGVTSRERAADTRVAESASERPAQPATPPRAEAAPPVRVEPARPAPERPPLAPPAASRAPVESADDLPADFLQLDRPVALLASVETELRQGPGRRFPKLRALAPGAEIEIDGRAGDWVRTTGGAWAFGPYFEAPDAALASGAFLARVEAIQARVHAGPSPQHEIVAELYRGEQVVIDEVKSEWAHVRDGGWVRMSELARLAAGEGR